MFVQMKVNVCVDPEINIGVALGIAAFLDVYGYVSLASLLQSARKRIEKIRGNC